MMAVVRRVGPGSAFKIGLVLYAILGLILGIFMACISLVAGSLGGLSMPAGGAPGSRLFGFGMGMGAIIFFPILYGVIGGIFAAIGAVVYNLVAGWVGGLEIDIS
jgi:Transmembrane domain of unknown function (DUF3566)